MLKLRTSVPELCIEDIIGGYSLSEFELEFLNVSAIMVFLNLGSC